MSNFFDLNLESLKQRLPKLAAVCLDAEREELSPEADGLGKTIKRPQPRPTLCLLEGFAEGKLCEELLARDDLEIFHLFVLEPSLPKFVAALHKRDLRHLILDNRVTFLVGIPAAQLFAEYHEILRPKDFWLRMNAFGFLPHPQRFAEVRPYFERARTEWHAARETLFLSAGWLEDSLLGVRNTWEGLSWIQTTPGVNGLKNIFANQPAILISTGPSLVRSLEFLRNVQDQALLIAVDASLKILLDAGVTPHLVVSLERDHGGLPFFQDAPFEKAKSPPHLVTFPVVPQDVIRAFQGPHWVAYRTYGYHYYLEKLMPRGVLMSSHSVAHLGINLMAYLGCGPGILVGQDLCFDPETLSSHSKGIAQYDEWTKDRSLDELKEQLRKQGSELLWVEGNRHNRVPTSMMYHLFCREISWERHRLQLELYNATAGGAKIEGVPWISADEALAKYKSNLNFFEVLDERHQPPANNQDVSVDFFARFVRPLTNNILKLNKEIRECPQSQREQMLGLLRQSRHALMNDQHFLYLIFDLTGRDLLKAENQIQSLYEKSPQSIDEVFEAYKEWMKIASHGAQEILKTVEFPEGGPSLAR